LAEQLAIIAVSFRDHLEMRLGMRVIGRKNQNVSFPMGCCSLLQIFAASVHPTDMRTPDCSLLVGIA
jgi:hypothetical protein